MIEINNKKRCESCFCEANGEPCPNCGFSASAYLKDPIVLPVGTKLNDKIVIGRVIGKGGFGITYLGYDLRIEKTIAVKEYYPNGIAYRPSSGTEVLIADAKSAEAFEAGAKKFYAEAEMVAQFNGNPNIVSVYDYFRANNTVYLVMEFLEGVTLKNYIKKHGRLTDGQALFVMDKIAAALSITHSAGVLHRDISPDNIMICKDGRIKLIDFGAARQIMAESSSNLTVVMKPGYTPIEQYTKKGEQGAWTDIYSLGASVYYALTDVIIDDPYARMDDDNEFAENKHGINGDLWEILKKCTMINASDRYGSAIDLRKALKSVSAPIKLEPIQLTDDDLKSNDVKDNEVKKVIEEPEVLPVDDNIENQEDDSRRRKKEKKPFIIAAAAILAAIAIIVGINIFSEKSPHIPVDNENKEDVESNTDGINTLSEKSPYTPVDSEHNEDAESNTDGINTLSEKPLYISFDDDNNANFKQISKNDLSEFEGDIKITLDIELIDSNADAILYIEDGDGKKIDIQAYNTGRNVYGCYTIFDGQTEFPFIITREVLGKVNRKIKMQSENLLIKGATVENYDPKEDEINPNAKIIQLDSEYPKGAYRSSEIPIEDLIAFNGDVRVTLVVEDVDANMGPVDREYWIQLTPLRNSYWEVGHIEPDYITPASWSKEWNSEIYYLGDIAVPDKFTFIITRDEIEKLDMGLSFSAYNILLKSAALEKAE